MATTQPAEAPRQCACWCGQPISAKSTFRQGHDQRLVGLVAEMVVDGGFTNEWVEYLQLPTEIDDQDIQVRVNHLSDAIAKKFSEGLARKAAGAAMRAWERHGKIQTKHEVDAEASVLEVEAVAQERTGELRVDAYDEQGHATPALGAPIRVKVGPRWEYNATVHGMNQSGKVTAVRYVPRSGKVQSKIATEGQFTIIPAR